MSLPIYLDYASTTPIDPRVLEVMMPYLQMPGSFGNASAIQHLYGQKAREAVENARAEFAQAIGAFSEDIIWTSGATESNNLAIKGYAQAYQHRGKHLITAVTEHKAVLDCFKTLAKQGFEVTFLPVAENGLVNIDNLQAALRPDTILVSLMYVNNETGVIQDIAAIANCLNKKNIVFHVDASQSLGKVPLDLTLLPIDLMSFSGHKIYGPKGIGVLYIRQKKHLKLRSWLDGGSQEKGLRAGTLPIAQIVGMAKATEISIAEQNQEQERLRPMQQYIEAHLQTIPGLYFNGNTVPRAANFINFSIDNIAGRELLAKVCERAAVSSGSACNAATTQPSYVLQAMGRRLSLAEASLRLSLGRFTTEEEVRDSTLWIEKKILELRKR